MRNSPVFRLLSALLGVLFAFNFSQPVWMSGMDMSGMYMGGMNMGAMNMDAMNMGGVRGAGSHSKPAPAAATHETAHHTMHETMHHDMHDTTNLATGIASNVATNTVHPAPLLHNALDQHESEQQSPAKTTAPECKQHECCAAAVVHAALSPLTSLSWLPDHVISRETPESVDCVVDTDVQLRLPFANGPPRLVTV